MKKSRPQGLGFLEVIIALSVMIVGVTSGLTLTTFNLATVVMASNRVLATGLARETNEIFRSWRDSQWIAGDGWLNQIDLTQKNQAINYFDKTTKTWKLNWSKDLNIDTCDKCKVVYDDTNKLFLQNYDSVTGGNLTNVQETGYRRLTKVQAICWEPTAQTQELMDFGKPCDTGRFMIGWRLTTDVTWYDNETVKTITINNELYDWR